MCYKTTVTYLFTNVDGTSGCIETFCTTINRNKSSVAAFFCFLHYVCTTLQIITSAYKRKYATTEKMNVTVHKLFATVS